MAEAPAGPGTCAERCLVCPQGGIFELETELTGKPVYIRRARPVVAAGLKNV